MASTVETISGKVIFIGKLFCNIKLPIYKGDYNVEVAVYDPDNTCKIGDLILAREMINPVKNYKFKVSQIIQRPK